MLHIIRYRTRDLEKVLDEINNTGYGQTLGVQPFGGVHLMDADPKVGRPHYLLRFATESTLTVNTTAAGANASLLELS